MRFILFALFLAAAASAQFAEYTATVAKATEKSPLDEKEHVWKLALLCAQKAPLQDCHDMFDTFESPFLAAFGLLKVVARNPVRHVDTETSYAAYADAVFALVADTKGQDLEVQIEEFIWEMAVDCAGTHRMPLCYHIIAGKSDDTVDIMIFLTMAKYMEGADVYIYD